MASGRRGATRVWKSRIFRDRLPKRHAWTKASKPVEFMGRSALPSLTEHLLFDGSCWVPGTKEAPVPRGACSVPLTLNVRKRSSLNLTAGGPLYGPHPSLHPPTHWAPAPGPLHVLLRVRAQMFFLHTNVIREFFPFGFYFKCNSTRGGVAAPQTESGGCLLCSWASSFSSFPPTRALIGVGGWTWTAASVHSVSSSAL